MRKDISDRDIYIIALQTNLMSSREEIDVMKKRNESLVIKSEELQKMVKEVEFLGMKFFITSGWVVREGRVLALNH